MSLIRDAGVLISMLTDGAIVSTDDWITKRSNANVETKYQTKYHRSGGAAAGNLVAGRWSSLWTMEGIPSHGVAPGAWANPTNTTAGSLMQTDPGGGRAKWLASYMLTNYGSGGILMIYDRLGHCSGLSGTSTAVQNINGGSPATITRYTTGERNHLFVEIYTAIGITATTITASYTNESGTLHTTQPITIGSGGEDEAQRILQMSLAQGDYGVRDVTSVTLAATTGTVGDFGVTIARPLMAIGIGTNGSPTITSFVEGPIAKILAGACLAVKVLPMTATAPTQLDSMFEMVEA